MRVTGDEYRDIGKFGGQCHHGIRKVIAASAGLESHVPCEHNRVCPVALCSRNRATHRIDGMLKINPQA